MKLLRSEKTEKYHEIEIENSFLFLKWRTVYRKSNGSILRFKDPDKYFPIGLSEYCDIIGLFKHLAPPQSL